MQARGGEVNVSRKAKRESEWSGTLRGCVPADDNLARSVRVKVLGEPKNLFGRLQIAKNLDVLGIAAIAFNKPVFKQLELRAFRLASSHELRVDTQGNRDHEFHRS
jgi:hypothetical protein